MSSLPPQLQGMSGIQLQDNQRRRLQALAIAQVHQSQNSNSVDKKQTLIPQGQTRNVSFNTQQNSGNKAQRDTSSNSTSTNGRFKIINTKLISFSKSNRNDSSNHSSRFGQPSKNLIKLKNPPGVSNERIVGTSSTNSDQLQSLKTDQKISLQKQNNGGIQLSNRSNHMNIDEISHTTGPVHSARRAVKLTSSKIPQPQSQGMTRQGSLGLGFRRQHQLAPHDITDEANLKHIESSSSIPTLQQAPTYQSTQRKNLKFLVKQHSQKRFPPQHQSNNGETIESHETIARSQQKVQGKTKAKQVLLSSGASNKEQFQNFFYKPKQENLTDSSKSNSHKSLNKVTSFGNFSSNNTQTNTGVQSLEPASLQAQRSKKFITDDSSLVTGQSTSRERVQLGPSFKYKKNSVNGKALPQKNSLFTQPRESQDVDRKTSQYIPPQIGKRRPLIIRKNNFVSQQSGSQPPTTSKIPDTSPMKLLQQNNKNKGPFDTEDISRRVIGKVSSTNVMECTSSSSKLRTDISAPPPHQSLTLNPPESSERRRIPLNNKQGIGPGSKLFAPQNHPLPENKTPKNRSKQPTMKDQLSLTHQTFTGVRAAAPSTSTSKNAKRDLTQETVPGRSGSHLKDTAGFSNLMSGAASGFNSTRRGFKRGQAIDPKEQNPRSEKREGGGINMFLKKLINNGQSPEEVLVNTQSSGGLQGQKNNSFNQLKEQNRLIKINRGKKKLDTARRSRLQQLKEESAGKPVETAASLASALMGHQNEFKSRMIPQLTSTTNVPPLTQALPLENIPIQSTLTTKAVAEPFVSNPPRKFFPESSYKDSSTPVAAAPSSGTQPTQQRTTTEGIKNIRRGQILRKQAASLRKHESAPKATTQSTTEKPAVPLKKDTYSFIERHSSYKSMEKNDKDGGSSGQTQSRGHLLTQNVQMMSSEEKPEITVATTTNSFNDMPKAEEVQRQQSLIESITNLFPQQVQKVNHNSPNASHGMQEIKHRQIQESASQVVVQTQPQNKPLMIKQILKRNNKVTNLQQQAKLSQEEIKKILKPAEAAPQPDEKSYPSLQPVVERPPENQVPSVNQNSDGATLPSRDILTHTADTSNRKQTTSFARNYCDSSQANAQRGIYGTAFSFNSLVGETHEIPKFPMSPQQALRYYSDTLTTYEKNEILDYPIVYYLGAPSAQKVQANQHLEHNFGYDDEKGDYKIVTHDHIGFRYQVKKFLGKGSFGTCILCTDHKTGEEMALKVIKNKKKYYYQAGIELKILQFLKENDPDDIMNVIHLNDYVVFRKHLCVGFELLSMNLFEFLKINDFNGFDHNLIRRFAIQLLYALKYLRMFQIIHCDLKPENILLKESNKSGIKIIDFGSSTFLDERVYTYIQSRFYRAPEIMLGIPYDCAIDMWSFGCIMAELYIGYPVFPGDSENDQMSRIIEMLGSPAQSVLCRSERKHRFFKPGSDGGITQEPIMMKNSRGKLRKPLGKPLKLVIGEEDPDFTSFVSACLEWDPKKRLTPDQALKHIWVLKGLPPQVLIHHQKMHNIQTPELPQTIVEARNQFLEEQTSMQQQPMRSPAKPEPQQTNRQQDMRRVRNVNEIS